MRALAALTAAVVLVLVVSAARAGAAPLTEFNLPTGATAGSLIDGPDGALWFGEETSTGVPELGRVTTSGDISTKAVEPTGHMGDVALGANGTIWFTLIDGDDSIGERTSSGQIKIFTQNMDGLGANAVPVELAEGANGAVWFIDHEAPYAIGEITPSGSIVEHPTGGYEPDQLTTTPNGDVWFTVSGPPGWVGMVSASAAPGSNATVYPTGSMSMPTEITAGDDGNVWFSDDGGPPAIARVTPSGTVTGFGNTDGLQMHADPDAVIAGPDGNVWFQDQYGNNPAVGRVTPTGTIKEFPLKHESWDLTVGIDANIWLATGDNGGTNPGVTRVIPATGKSQFFSAGLGSGAVVGDGTNIVSGPDGDLWLIDVGKPYAIVRADVQLPPTATTGTSSVVTSSSAHVTGSANPRGAATTVSIQYGKSPSLGSSAAAGTLAEANASAPVSATLTGLPGSTIIYYRVSATNAYGTVTGATKSFTTAKGSAPSPPPPGSGSGTKTVHATVGNQRVTLTLPSTKACLAPSAKLSLKVDSATIDGSKAAKLKFKQAAVFIDRGVKRTHSKVVVKHHHKHRVRVTVFVPNAKAGHVPATLKPSLHRLKSGSHSLRVRLTYTRTRHMHHHTVHSTVTKTIKLRFKVC